MVIRTLGLCVVLFTTISLSFAQGRKPAVEDFVGIEVDQGEVTPAGSEVLYNLEQDLQKINDQKNKAAPKATLAVAESKAWSMSTIVGISFFLGLPLMIWLIMMSYLKKKASVESASNIEVLEKYRKDREKKLEENIRKAS
jgi:uncharacterized membrane protein YciS (DUF1049 family)